MHSQIFLPHPIQKDFKARKIKAPVGYQLIKAPGKPSKCLHFLIQGLFFIIKHKRRKF